MAGRLLPLFALLAASSIATTAALPTIPDAGRTALEDCLRASVAHGDAPAIVAAVANPDRLMFEAAAGKRTVTGNAPATVDTIFRIASMTKPVTSTAVMMLV